jgi:hypothetical protein
MENDKHTRSVRIAGNVHDRLLAVCDHFGVNPNAYIVAEIGRAVSRDEIALVAQVEREGVFDQIRSAIESETAK